MKTHYKMTWSATHFAQRCSDAIENRFWFRLIVTGIVAAILLFS